MIRILSSFLLFAALALGQYAAIQGTDYPANSLGILNAKPTVRTGVIAPTGNCTAGLDLWVDTAAMDLYYCGALNVWTKAGKVASVFGRTGPVTANAGDYTAAQVTNAVDSTSTYENPSWITSLAWSKLTSVPSTFTPSAHTHIASETTGGVFDVSLIPDLSAAKITSGTMALARLAQSGATTNQAIVWNGSAWAPATVTGAGGYGTIEYQGTPVTQRTTANFVGSDDIIWNITDQATKTQIQSLIDSTKWATRSQIQSGADTFVTGASASGSAYVVAPLGKVLSAYADGMRLSWRPDVTATGDHTIDVSTLGARCTYRADGTTRANGTDVIGGRVVELAYETALPSCSGSTGGFRIINGGGIGGGGDFSSSASSSVDNELVLYSGTTGKEAKRAAFTGFVRAASGVASAAAISNADLSSVVLPDTRVYVASPLNFGGTNGLNPHFSSLGTFGGVTYVNPTFSANTAPGRGHMVLPVAVSGTNYTGFSIQDILDDTWQAAQPTIIQFYANTGSTTGNRTYQVAVACVSPGEPIDGALAYNSNQEVVQSMSSASVSYVTSITLDMTGCIAGDSFFVKVARPDTTAGDIRLRQVRIKSSKALN